MEKLLMKQEDMFDHMNKAYSNYKKSPKERLKVNYIEARLENLEKLYEAFVHVHSEIVGSVKRDDKSKLPYFTEDVYFHFEEIYTDYKTKMKDDLQIYDVKPCSFQTNGPGESSLSSTKVKLPQIQLPKFSGSYEEWQTFYDMFISLIHQNVTLSDVQKMHYLKSSLTGEPETLLKNFSTTESNYGEAFKQLTRRYNNKRYICNEIMKRLFAQQNVTETASSIKQLLDVTSSSLKSLENIGIIISSCDVFVNYLVLSRLDLESRKLWEVQVSQLDSDELPSWGQLVKFLETRFRTLEMLSDNKPATKSQFTHPNTSKPKVFHSTTQDDNMSNIICASCKSQHFLYQCKQFGQQSPQERSEFVQSKRLCFNCFAPTHSVKECRSSACCRRCGRRHHTLLHFERNDSTGNSSSSTEKIEEANSNIEPSKNIENKVVAHLITEKFQRETLLATAVVKAYSANGYSQLVRVLIDPCSEGSFITESTAQLLGLKRVCINGLVSGIGESLARSKNMVSFSVESIYNTKYSIKVEAYVLKNLTPFLPTCQTSITDWLDIERVQLADPNYGSPAKIDIILGVEVFEDIILEGLMRHPSGKGPIAQETQFGWILSGRVRRKSNSMNSQIINCHIRVSEDEIPKQFCETEREPDAITKTFTKEETKCGQMFEITTKKDDEERYEMKLPFNQNKPKCVDESKIVEKKFQEYPSLYEEYKKECPSRWRTFGSGENTFSNGVVEFHATLNSNQWSHTSTHDNLADYESRGIEMAGLTLWWHGQELLRKCVYSNINEKYNNFSITKEQTPIKTSIAVITSGEEYISKYSNSKMVLRICCCKRFLHNFELPKTQIPKYEKFINVIEMQDVLVFWFVTMHGDLQIMFDYLHSKCWEIRARVRWKKIDYRVCTKYLRYLRQNNHQLMDSFPKVKLKPSKTVKASEVNFNKFFNIQFLPGGGSIRGSILHKSFVSSFVCVSMKTFCPFVLTNAKEVDLANQTSIK